MTAKHATFRDFYLHNLRGGPESPQLEFTADYYQMLLKVSGGRLTKLLQKEPDAAALLAPSAAVTAAIEFFHPEFEGNFYDDKYKGTASRYRDVARLAVQMFRLSPEDFDIETVPVEQNLLIPPTELREVARLAVQQYQVYVSLAETGEVPTL